MFRKTRYFFFCFTLALLVSATGCAKAKSPAGSKTSAQVPGPEQKNPLESEASAFLSQSEDEDTEDTDTADFTAHADSKEAPGTSLSPAKKAEAFAEMVQEAVADRDLEAFASLLYYPCLITTKEQETVILETKEDLMKQNPELVFGEDFMVAVANVDTAALEQSDEGFLLGEEFAGITFAEKPNGNFGIKEIRE